MKRSILLFAFSLLISGISAAVAQTPSAEMHGPPKALQIVREDIKPGKMAAHNKHSASFVRIFSTLQTPNHRLALLPVAGSENEVVYLTAADSFAEFEKIQKDTDKMMSGANAGTKAELDRLDKEAPELHTGMQDMLAIYRPDLSFNPEVNVPQMRYIAISTVHIRPGHDAEYAEYVNSLVNVAREKAKIGDFHVATYQVISGAPGGTYLAFRPMKSLKEFDEPIGMKVRAAMTDEMRAKADKTAGDAILSTESSTYAFEPKMSYVSTEFASGDPTFWNQEPEKAAVVKKRGKKPRAKTANKQAAAKQ
jgi:hypothetical protein